MKFKTAFLTLLAVAGLSCGASAQSWGDLLGGLLGGSSSSQTEQKVAETYPESLLGTWRYSAPAVVFTGDDIIAKLGGSVASSTIKEQMSAYYTKAGVTPQTCTVQFRRNGKFVAKASQHEIEGRYSYNASSGALSVTATLDDLGTRTFIGKVTGNGDAISITFESSKVVSIAREIPSVSNDSRMMSLIGMVEQYKGLYLGAELAK